MTLGNYFRTYYVHSTIAATNPGKRISAFDFSYRIPGLRNWLTVYSDSLVVDEISPIGSTRPTVNPGIYMPRIPKMPKLELRIEALELRIRRNFRRDSFILISAGFVTGTQIMEIITIKFPLFVYPSRNRR